MEGLWKLFSWITRFAYLNILWIFFSMIGLFILGFGPATVALFAVMRKLLNDEHISSIGKFFYAYYRKNFWKANQLMLVVYPASFIMYVDFLFLRQLPNSFLLDRVVFPSMILLTLLLIIFFSYLFAVFVHFDIPYFTNFKYAVLIAGINPLPTTLMVLGLFVFFLVLLIIPAISIFYLVSIPVGLIQLCTKFAFRKINRNQIN